MRYLYVFALGGTGYALLEIAFRGTTHWTMLLTGGACVTAIYFLHRHARLGIWQLCLLGGGIITAVELGVGMAVNLALGWDVWDYSAVPMNFLGQICPMFSAVWVLLTLPALKLCRALDKYIFSQGQGSESCAVNKSGSDRL
ncbi:MAG: hypothetical protein IJ072_03360 [Oscillospiraceae bacterium]|nr:hypothetical protein [Oscillospiraceae bacterium]